MAATLHFDLADDAGVRHAPDELDAEPVPVPPVVPLERLGHAGEGRGGLVSDGARLARLVVVTGVDLCRDLLRGIVGAAHVDAAHREVAAALEGTPLVPVRPPELPASVAHGEEPAVDPVQVAQQASADAAITALPTGIEVPPADHAVQLLARIVLYRFDHGVGQEGANVHYRVLHRVRPVRVVLAQVERRVRRVGHVAVGVPLVPRDVGVGVDLVRLPQYPRHGHRPEGFEEGVVRVQPAGARAAPSPSAAAAAPAARDGVPVVVDGRGRERVEGLEDESLDGVPPLVELVLHHEVHVQRCDRRPPPSLRCLLRLLLSLLMLLLLLLVLRPFYVLIDIALLPFYPLPTSIRHRGRRRCWRRRRLPSSHLREQRIWAGRARGESCRCQPSKLTI